MPTTIQRILSLSGVAAVLFYLTHVILGGALWEGYSHLMQPISDLTATGAPDRGLLTIFTNIYGLFAVVFCFMLIKQVKNTTNSLVLAGAIVLLCMHLVSLSYGLFPEDLPGAEMTIAGMMHLLVTALIVPLTIAAPILTGLGLLKLAGERRMGVYSLICGVAILVLGGITAMMFATGSGMFGLFERLNIGTLQAWTATLSIWLYRRCSQPAQP
ncbi:MAG: DUF998 domain-containing protein [Candidatus Marinimicrobia bacterium]|nr:DUF998 domain-containing protein [Candidatus Neomarinimicrobiota bacterium]